MSARRIATCIALLCAACSGRIGGSDAAPRAAPSTSSASGPAAIGGDASALSLESTLQRCDSSRIGPPQLWRLTLRQLDNTLRDIFPDASAEFQGFRLNDVSSILGFDNAAPALVVSPQTAGAILDAAEQLAGIVTSSAHLASLDACATHGDKACASDLITRYGKRLFRRPLTAAEVSSYGALFDTVAAQIDFASALKWTLVALIESPHTLYRRELGDLSSDISTLSGYELATELAYTFGDSAPDDALLELAEGGQLSDPDVRLAQAQRLSMTPRGQEALRQFFREWLHYEDVKTADRSIIPGFNDVRSELVEETQRYLDQVLFADHGGVRELLTSPFTFVDAPLADYYGLADKPAAFAKIDRDAAHGVGILAQGSLLASAANASASSPTQRGLLVREKLLCRTRPKPPANVPPLSVSNPDSYKTTRQHYEVAHAQGFCASCHTQFDPIGFGFEHFDQGGRYRADENGEPIDATGTLYQLDGSEAFEFDGLGELAAGLAADPDVVDCVSGLVVAYAFGEAGGMSCLAESARQGISNGDYGLVELWSRLVAEPHFTTRDVAAAVSGDAPPSTHDAGMPAAAMNVLDAAAPVSAPPSRADIGISAQYQASNAAPSDNVIGPFLQITNHGAGPVALDSLRMRYYFRNEQAELCPDACLIEGYYAGIHPSGQGVMAKRAYVASGVASGGNGASDDAYLEISFEPGSAALQPGESVEVQQYFHTNPYRDFDESNDYSFDATFDSFRDSPKVTVFQGDALVWGEPPP